MCRSVDCRNRLWVSVAGEEAMGVAAGETDRMGAWVGGRFKVLQRRH